jgi:hypothetical protein
MRPARTVEQELDMLRARDAVLEAMIDSEAALVKIEPTNSDYCRRWANLCELRCDLKRYVGLLSMMSGHMPRR